MTTVADVKRWIAELLPQGEDQYAKYVRVLKEEKIKNPNGSRDTHRLVVSIFTRSRRYYRIVAKEEDIDGRVGYLGCQFGNSYPLAGEDHSRGNDLPDGQLNEDTWNRIIRSIISRELRLLGT